MMKKSAKTKKAKPANRKAPRAKASVQREPRSLRALAGPLLAILLFAGGIGFWGVQTVMASMAERDLTNLGQGTPTIVQVHDVQCAPCMALQREVRGVLADFDDDVLDYRVADLRSDEGLLFASGFGAGHTTLLFFDAEGALTRQVTGVQSREFLTTAFSTLVGE